MAKKYIRFTTKGLRFEGMVAQHTRTLVPGDHTPGMYAFLYENVKIQYVPTSEAEFISAKEYFTEILKGREFHENG